MIVDKSNSVLRTSEVLPCSLPLYINTVYPDALFNKSIKKYKRFLFPVSHKTNTYVFASVNLRVV